MTPTFFGRIQTRIFLIAVIGSLWTLVVTPFLPSDGSLSETYEATFAVLVVVLVLGLAWEVLYQGLQQFRWEKDWPTGFGLILGIPEGIVVWLVVSAGLAPGDPEISGAAFIIHFATTWLVTYLFVLGPMRVPFLRWRFRGGRIV